MSEKEIKEAYFSFDYAFFEEDALKEFKGFIEKAVSECEGCEVYFEKSEGYEPMVDDFGGGIAPVIPSRRYFLSGRIRGYLPSVVNLRKVMSEQRMGDISRIKLVF